jgi:type IV secretory pathway component VirB8
MSDKTIPGFVYDRDLIAQAAATQSWMTAQAKRDRRSRNGWRVLAVGSLFLLGLSVSALNYTIPGIRLLPILLWTAPDGTTGAALTTDSLPADLSDATIKAWLWQYIMHREGYSWVEADYNHYVVDAMSDVPVRQAYDAWISGKNPKGYQVIYGRRGVVRVGLREITEFRRPTPSVPGRITVHFERLVAVEGEPRKPPETWSVTLDFLQGYNSGFNMMDVISFNPSRIVVTDYPGAVPLPATPNAIAQP